MPGARNTCRSQTSPLFNRPAVKPVSHLLCPLLIGRLRGVKCFYWSSWPRYQAGPPRDPNYIRRTRDLELRSHYQRNNCNSGATIPEINDQRVCFFDTIQLAKSSNFMITRLLSRIILIHAKNSEKEIHYCRNGRKMVK